MGLGIVGTIALMTNNEVLIKLITKWTVDSEGYKAEAQRLELADRSRHGISITMLESRAQALDRCILDVETLIKA